MKILSFSAVEVLPALLNKTKQQTIRPAWKECVHRTPDESSVESCRWIGVGIHTIEKSACFKVGEKVQLGWKVRGTPKFQLFHRKCGNKIGWTGYEWICDVCHDTIGDVYSEEQPKDSFSKLLGTAIITEVFQIEMGKGVAGFYISSAFGSERDSLTILGTPCDAIAKKDGFKNSEDMFKWFDSKYGLSSPKTFWMYRWKWLS